MVVVGEESRRRGDVVRIEMRKGGVASTTGQRHVRRIKVETKGGRGRVPRKVRVGKRKQGGRNNQGKRTVRHRGGGVKQGRRKRVNGGRETGRGRVRGIQYDPTRTGRVARRKVVEGDRVGSERKTEYKYVLAAEGRRVGDRIQYGAGGELASKGSQRKRKRTGSLARSGIGIPTRRRGSTVRRKERDPGRKVCNVEVSPGEGGKYRRTAGGRGEVRVKMGGRVQIRRMGGKRREVSEECTATVGRVSGEDHSKESRGKAGRKRRRGIRPTVRGEAMNPIDHPHGGRTRGGRAEVTPWTRRAKGKPTRKSGKARGKGWVVSKTR